jgi:hypothetical protein
MGKSDSTRPDLYPGFASHWIDTAAGRVFARSGGTGPPLLLQFRQGRNTPGGNLLQPGPKCILQAHARLVPCDDETSPDLDQNYELPRQGCAP